MFAGIHFQPWKAPEKEPAQEKVERPKKASEPTTNAAAGSKSETKPDIRGGGFLAFLLWLYSGT
jgi:hypothetical protein